MKKKFVQIKLIGGGTYIQSFTQQGIGTLIDEILEGQTGEEWHVKIVEMTQAQYDLIPEFTGH